MGSLATLRSGSAWAGGVRLEGVPDVGEGRTPQLHLGLGVSGGRQLGQSPGLGKSLFEQRLRCHQPVEVSDLDGIVGVNDLLMVVSAFGPCE